MRREVVAILIALCEISGAASAQEPSQDASMASVKIVRLSPPVYPPIARQARILAKSKSRFKSAQRERWNRLLLLVAHLF